MPRTIHVDHQSKIVYSTFTGELTDQALLLQCSEVSALPINDEYRELVDLTGVTHITASGQTIRAVASRPSPFSKLIPRVILVGKQEQYGMGRMAQSYAELSGSAPFQVVNSKEAAKILRVDVTAIP